MISFAVSKLISFIRSYLLIFVFISIVMGDCNNVHVLIPGTFECVMLQARQEGIKVQIKLRLLFGCPYNRRGYPGLSWWV